jgi:hypothetical protein
VVVLINFSTTLHQSFAHICNSLIPIGMGSSPLGLNHNFSSPGSLPTILDASPHFEVNGGAHVTDNMLADPTRAPVEHSRPRAIPESKGTKRYNPAEG